MIGMIGIVKMDLQKIDTTTNGHGLRGAYVLRCVCQGCLLGLSARAVCQGCLLGLSARAVC
jgi:hypothetical protein